MASSKILNFFNLTALGLGSALGVGIFVLIGELSKNVAGPAIVVSVAIAGIVATLAGLCLSELGTWYLKTDNLYAFSYSCNKENVAFTFGWALVLQYVAGSASVVKGIITFIDALTENKISDFLTEVAPIHFKYVSSYFDFISVIVVIVQMFLIAIGMKDWRRLKSTLVIGNIILLTVIIIIGLFKENISNWGLERNEGELIEGSFSPYGFLGVIKGAAIVLFGFIGIERIGISGMEVKTHRHVPLAVLATTSTTTIFLLAVGAVLTFMYPYNELNAFAAFPFAFERMQWTACKWVVAVGAFMGFQTSLFGVTFPLSRVIYAMAKDGLLFHFLTKKYSKTNTPFMAISAGGLLAGIAAGIFSFLQLVHLTVITTLFVYTIIAADVIILRYKGSSDENEGISESTNLFVKNKTISLKTILRNSFSCSTSSTYITEKIILGNLILFCSLSVSLSIIFFFFNEELLRLALEAIIPAVILACLMILSLVSMMCQLKSQKDLYFRVPLVPLLPCLSIFLNIFLMVSFESSTWVRFLIWMALGIIPHMAWYFFKCYKNEVGENSLYEINKMNTVKFNESIWKIKSKKKFFFEGATNPAFKDETEDTLYEGQNKSIGSTSNKIEKSSLELKQAEVIQMADLILEERADPLNNNNLVWESEQTVINETATESGTTEQVSVQEEKVQWECVAEIHSEKELPQEIIALEIVDNTYNFLSEVAEELKDNISQTSSNLEPSDYKSEENTEKNKNVSEKQRSKPAHDDRVISSVPENETKENKSFHSKLKEELLNKIRDMKNKEKVNGLKSLELDPVDMKMADEKVRNRKMSNNKFNSLPSKLNLQEGDNEIVQIGVESKHLAENIEERDSNKKANSEVEEEKGPQDEQNKVKEFKEKLNHILKSQINVNASFTKKLMVSKFSNKNVEDVDSLEDAENKKKDLYKNIKTLNKSQIRNKLELLLSKGPPKRASLRDSFILKANDTAKENAKEDILKVQKDLNESEPKVTSVAAANESDVDQVPLKL